jgi:hypothetical protein
VEIARGRLSGDPSFCHYSPWVGKRVNRIQHGRGASTRRCQIGASSLARSEAREQRLAAFVPVSGNPRTSPTRSCAPSTILHAENNVRHVKYITKLFIPSSCLSMHPSRVECPGRGVDSAMYDCRAAMRPPQRIWVAAPSLCQKRIF